MQTQTVGVGLLDESVTASCGYPVVKSDIQSSLGPFRVLPDYVTTYPPVVIEALSQLYVEYNKSFSQLVAVNQEWPGDYQYCWPNGGPENCCVQIDMVGLSEQFLEDLAGKPVEEVREILRRQIFEIENSIAVYQVLERFFAKAGKDSFFKIRFRGLLENLRLRIGKPLALLAVTEEKYQAMRMAEFGCQDGEVLTNEKVKELSGFDAFFGPSQFLDYLAINNGKCGYALYVRSSDPVSKLKKPDLMIEHPLLSPPEIRRVIKANALTFNLDAPEMAKYRRINDTKGYMPILGMAYRITFEDDLRSPDFLEFCESFGVDREAVAAGKVAFRFKPAQGTFGCYGHVVGPLDGRTLRELRRQLRIRGDYMVQPEMPTPEIANLDDGQVYAYIDRVFFGLAGREPEFLGGVRNLMPKVSAEAQGGRIHGNAEAVYAEIIG